MHINLFFSVLLYRNFSLYIYYSCIEKERTKYNILIALINPRKQPDIKM